METSIFFWPILPIIEFIVLIYCIVSIKHLIGKREYILIGTIIGFSVSIIVSIFSILMSELCRGLCIDSTRNIVAFIVNIITSFDFLAFFVCGKCDGWNGIIHIYTIYFSYTIIGYICGLIYEKIKKFIKK